MIVIRECCQYFSFSFGLFRPGVRKPFALGGPELKLNGGSRPKQTLLPCCCDAEWFDDLKLP